MDQAALSRLLDDLIARWESEVVEFKLAGNDYDTDKIGEYFSALSNEANLRNEECAWLVFGVDNKSVKLWSLKSVLCSTNHFAECAGSTTAGGTP